MLSDELEYCLNQAFHRAREARHEYLTVEHLLAALVEAPQVRDIVWGCGGDPARLTQELQEHIDQWTSRLEQGDQREVLPTIGFQRVLQRAVFHVQSAGKKAVTVLDVLLAMFSEKQSQAVFALDRHHVTRAEVVRYRKHQEKESVGESRPRFVPVDGRALRMARLLGPALIGIAVSEWMNRDLALTGGPATAPYVYLSGILIFVAGLAIVSAYNVWSRKWSVLIPVVGWLGVIAGLACMAVPAVAQNAERNAPVFYALLVVLLAAGTLLTFKAYTKPASPAS